MPGLGCRSVSYTSDRKPLFGLKLILPLCTGSSGSPPLAILLVRVSARETFYGVLVADDNDRLVGCQFL